MNVTLVVVGGKAKTTEVRLKLPTIIGRGRECTLTLPHPLVSRRHCELFEADGRLLVRDLGSMNGTFVGNQRITEVELPHNGLLTIGEVTFRAVYESAAAAAGSARPPLNPAELDTTLDQDTHYPADAPPPEPVAGDTGDESEPLEEFAEARPAPSGNPSAVEDDDTTDGCDVPLPPPAAPANPQPASGKTPKQRPAATNENPSTPDQALNEFLSGLDQ